MKPTVFLSEVQKFKTLTGATDADIQRITGWSVSTMRRRFNNPESITLGEAYRIISYLGIK